jgi:membrane protease YdiL (CAAX protease family)
MEEEGEALPQNEQAADNAAPEKQLEMTQPRPWGFWATIGFSCAIAAAYLIMGIIVTLAFMIPAGISNPKFDAYSFVETLNSNGTFLWISAIACAAIVTCLVFVFAGIRKQITIKDYLCLKNPGFRQILKWSVIIALFVFFSDGLTYLLGRKVVPQFMIDTYLTANFLPLLWLALIMAAPLSEEFFFRGFLFKGIECSKLGPVWAIIITSFLWSILHSQYDLYGIATIFVGGLILGLARLKSGSLYVPLAMHAVFNFIATVECAVYLTFFLYNK